MGCANKTKEPPLPPTPLGEVQLPPGNRACRKPHRGPHAPRNGVPNCASDLAAQQARLDEQPAQLEAAEGRFKNLFRRSGVATAVLSPDGRLVQVNQALCRMLGYTEGELRATRLEDLTHPGDRQAHVALMHHRGSGDAPPGPRELRYIHKAAHVVWAVVSVFGDAPSPDGSPQLLAQMEDLTKYKRLQEQVYQEQKRGTLGRLAAGIAHDLNNLLTVILSYCDSLLSAGLPGDGGRSYVMEVQKAGELAAGLTRRLLAFGATRAADPRPISLNEVAGGLDKMLRRLLGENIELATRLDPALRQTRADPGQIEQVLLNLAVNSRDAMPGGGKLTIETRNVELARPDTQDCLAGGPGSYVTLAVTDTGCGMDEQTRARAFEAFFTTKKNGEGTGLGLSIVADIVRQYGGFTEVASTPGKGTAIRIYLPSADESGREAPQDAPAAAENGRETILLVEDEPMVRELVRVVLHHRGYSVLEAGDGAEALQVAAGHAGPIHLLLTDMVLPGRSGGDLGRELTRRRPGLKVLYLSGYPDKTLRSFGLAAEVPILSKPFRPAQLARRVREVLDS